MTQLDSQATVVLLLHGGTANLTGKTGLAMLRYRKGPIVAVVDPEYAGQNLRAITGIDRAVPIVASVAEALAHGPEVAVVGLAPSGGRLPPAVYADVAAALRPDTILVSVLLANNEIGVIQDIPAIAEIVHAAGAVLHVDAAQGLGRMTVDVDALGADLASFSGHKCHGPKGVGAVYVRRRGRAVRIEPLVYGGGQERGLRSGTIDVPAIVGLAEAARLANAELAADVPRMQGLRDSLWTMLAGSIPGLALNGPSLEACDPRGRLVRLVNNLNVHVPEVDGQSLLATLAADGLALSSGSACASESPGPSHVLQAIGRDQDQARASLRFGLSRFTTAADVTEAAARISAGVIRLRSL